MWSKSDHHNDNKSLKNEQNDKKHTNSDIRGFIENKYHSASNAKYNTHIYQV